MIYELYSFSPGTIVVADEWNSNFAVLNNNAIAQEEAIIDGNNDLALKSGDLSSVYARANTQPNSYIITGLSFNVTSPNQEFWLGNELTSSQQLNINVQKIKGEVRILFKTDGSIRDFSPIVLTYAGGAEAIDFIEDNRMWSNNKTKVLFLYEMNDRLNVRMVEQK